MDEEADPERYDILSREEKASAEQIEYNKMLRKRFLLCYLGFNMIMVPFQLLENNWALYLVSVLSFIVFVIDVLMVTILNKALLRFIMLLPQDMWVNKHRQLFLSAYCSFIFLRAVG